MYVTLLPISSTATSRVYRNSILEQTYMGDGSEKGKKSCRCYTERRRASGPTASSLLLPGKWHFRVIGFERKL